MPQKFPIDSTTPMSKASTDLQASMASIDAPQISSEGQLEVNAKSVKSANHAWTICTAMETANKARSQRTADIQAMYDGAAPFSFGDKVTKAQSWQANFNTRWLAGITDTVTGRLAGAITSQITLTRSSLPSDYPQYKDKSDFFCNITSKMIRSWSGYKEMIDNLSQETSLHGYSYAIFLDPFTWRPTFFKQENAYVPEQSSQHAEELQFAVAKQDYQLHEFIEKFTDEAAAAEAGYHIENCVEAANKAQVANPRDDILTTQYRKFQDMIADGTLGLTYTAVGARIVKTYMLWNREYDGQVSFWLLNRDTGALLRYVHKAYKSMGEVMSMFALESGNGHIHSSKGIGRKLIATALAIEMGRCGAMDNARMASLMILRVPAKDRAKLQPVIHNPFVVMDKEIEIEQSRFQADPSMYLGMDSQLTMWAQQNAGAYISRVDPSGRSDKTATEASIDAQRQQEQSTTQLSRWQDQHAVLIGKMQQRAFNDDVLLTAEQIFIGITQGTLETEATYDQVDELYRAPVRAAVEMLKYGLTIDEIKLLRKSSASVLVHIDQAAVSAGINRVAATYTGNPNVDQLELVRRNIEAIAGPEAAKALVIDNLDQTVLAEASRLQTLESSAMYSTSLPVPVSMRDHHLVHISVLQTLLRMTMPELSKNPEPAPQLMKAIELNINHYAEHMNFVSSDKAADQKAVSEAATFLNQFKSDFAKAIQVQEQYKTTMGIAKTAEQMAVAKAQADAAAVSEPAQVSEGITQS